MLNSTSGNCSAFQNVSDDRKAMGHEVSWNDAARQMWLIWAPLIVAFGVVGNVLTLILLGGLGRRSAAFLFLMALAASDLMILLVGLVPFWYGWLTGVWLVEKGLGPCLFFKYVGRSVGMLSAFLLAVLTAYRALAAAMPYTVRANCSVKKARLAIIIVCAIVFGVNCHLFYLVKYMTDSCRWTKHFYEHYFVEMSWANGLLFAVLPSVVVATSSSFLVRSVAKLAPARRFSAVTGHQEAARQQGLHVRRTVIIMSVALAFMVLTLPNTIMRLVHIHMKRTELSKFVYEFALLLWYSNAAINFYLYICTGPELRRRTVMLLSQAYNHVYSACPVVRGLDSVVRRISTFFVSSFETLRGRCTVSRTTNPAVENTM